MINKIKQIPERLLTVEGLGGKIAHNHFSEPQTLPFCVYDFSQNSQGADDLHNLLKTSVTVTLYQEVRNFDLEKDILKVFSDVEVNTYNDYISEEKMYMTEFNFEFFEKI